MSFGVFRNKLKKKAVTSYEWSPPQKAVKLSDVEVLLVETEKTHLLIPKKQLEEKLDDGVHWRVWEFIKKELLELGEKKCQDMVNIDQNGI